MGRGEIEAVQMGVRPAGPGGEVTGPGGVSDQVRPVGDDQAAGRGSTVTG
jgi:hypothetical protein